MTQEKPILFSGPMIRAILDGTKTQTRRVVTGAPHDLAPGISFHCHIPCPYGKPGNRLWVRETWQHHPDGDGCIYRATDPGWDDNNTGTLWRPSIFMPRNASRITLDVCAVRVERLQEITAKDAQAEGAPYEIQCGNGMTLKEHDGTGWREGFRILWDSINGKRKATTAKQAYSWASNPFVWVLEFRRVTP